MATTAVVNELFHEGEVAIQKRYGVHEAVAGFSKRMIRDHLNGQHRDYFSEIPYIVIAAREHNSAGAIWCSLVASEDGVTPVATALDDTHLRLDVEPKAEDPVGQAMAQGGEVGVLGIMLHNRRRNRVNGHLSSGQDGRLVIEVDSAYGNCPQYISLREVSPLPSSARAAPGVSGEALTPELAHLVSKADTFFIASGYQNRSEGSGLGRGLDASHRGGAPGFVQVSEDGSRLMYRDQPGNNIFNTMGNMLLDPRVGVTFLDFAKGDALQITGEGHIVFNDDDTRTVTIHVHRYIYRPGGLGVRFASPTSSVQPLRLLRSVDEGQDIKSLYFTGAGDGALQGHAAGQYLTIRVPEAGVERSYSLSGDPRWTPLTRDRPSMYRITVRKQGRASKALHAMREGDIVEGLGAPMGEFVLPEAAKHPNATLVFLGAGIGVTPLVAMLYEASSLPQPPALHFLQTATASTQWPLHREIAALLADAGGRGAATSYFTTFTRETPLPMAGLNVGAGRLDAEVLRQKVAPLPLDNVYFFLCGPQSFMSDAERTLLAMGVPEERVLGESFGPSALGKKV